MDGLLDGIADPEDGVLARGTEPEVAVLHQKGGAVFLGGDGIILGHLQNLQGPDRKLIAGRRPFVLPHHSPDDDGRFLGDLLPQFEGLLIHLVPGHHPLDNAGAVPDLQEVDLARGPLVVQPALEGDLAAYLLTDIGDIGEIKF